MVEKSINDKTPVKLTLKAVICLLVTVAGIGYTVGGFVASQSAAQKQLAENQKQISANQLAIATMLKVVQQNSKEIEQHCKKDKIIDAGDVRDVVRE